MTTTTPAKFSLVLPTVKPGDFGPSAYAVYNEKAECVLVRDGAIVEAIGEVEVEYEDDVKLGFRRVRLADGFEGRVTWHDFNGHSGFKAVNS